MTVFFIYFLLRERSSSGEPAPPGDDPEPEPITEAKVENHSSAFPAAIIIIINSIKVEKQA